MRQLRKSPAFTATATLTLGLGIAACLAIFSAVDALFVRPLGFPDSTRLVRLWAIPPDAGPVRYFVSYARYRVIAREQTVFSSIAATAPTTFALTERTDPEQLTGLRVSANFFATAGVRPVLGRDFTPADDKPGAMPVAILAHKFWAMRFGGDPAVVGKSLTLDGVPTTIVGVLPASFGVPFADNAVYVPRVFDLAGMSALRIERGAGFIQPLGRLRPGVTLREADEDMKRLSARYAAEDPTRIDTKSVVKTYRLQEDSVSTLRPAFAILSSAVGLVLLLACSNIAGLFIARFLGRRRELAVRAAMGATRRQLVLELSLEALLLSALGGAAGLLMGAWALDGIARLGRDFFPVGLQLTINRDFLWCALAAVGGCAVLTGLVPAWQLSVVNVSDALAAGGRGPVGAAPRQRLRAILVGSQVALSSVLLVGAGLLVASFARLQRHSPGFDYRHLATADMTLAPTKYPNGAARARFYDVLIDHLVEQPGVDGAAVIFGLPFGQFGAATTYGVAGKPLPPPQDEPYVSRCAVSPGYFAVMKIPVRAGRDFTAWDDASRPSVAIISESLAHKLFPRENPLGQKLIIGVQSNAPTEIVGVVADVDNSAPGAQQAPTEQVYFAIAQHSELTFSVVVRGDAGPPPIASLLRHVLPMADSAQPFTAAQPMADLLAQSIADRRVTAWLLGGFSAIALAMAGLGLYGLIAFLVRQRTPEIGVRLAIGATPRAIVRLVFQQAAFVIAAGLAVGLSGAVALNHLLAAWLVGTNPNDPRMLGGAALLVSLVAIVAIAIPARRAMKIDPLAALRAE